MPSKSGSMVALHQACLTLKSGSSRVAIVGGTELLLHPDQTVAMSQVGYVFRSKSLRIVTKMEPCLLI
jgi:acyl transferase domain-containing protein